MRLTKWILVLNFLTIDIIFTILLFKKRNCQYFSSVFITDGRKINFNHGYISRKIVNSIENLKEDRKKNKKGFILLYTV
jgi:hypothetical protein